MEVLGARLRLDTPVMSCAAVEKGGSGGARHALTGGGGVSLGTFHEVIFACHPPDAAAILRAGAEATAPHGREGLCATLDRIVYEDNGESRWMPVGRGHAATSYISMHFGPLPQQYSSRSRVRYLRPLRSRTHAREEGRLGQLELHRTGRPHQIALQRK